MNGVQNHALLEQLLRNDANWGYRLRLLEARHDD